VAEVDYDPVFARRAARPLSFALDRYSDDDIGALSGAISYISRRDTERHCQIIRRSLARVKRDSQIILEVGCGTGGYVRYLSTHANFPAIGIDLSQVAIAVARRFATPETQFFCRDASNSELPCSVAGAALAIDTFYLTEERTTVLDEMFRVLAPRAALVFTILHTGPSIDDTVLGWSVALQTAGFAIVAKRDISGEWQRHMLAKHSWRWSRRTRLRGILGSWVEPELNVSAAMLGLGPGASVAKNTFRFEIVAVRQ
jgi:ubiquinone/menaquinone biosynthesis C-methylase UbiE